jgi:hypothetical protein
MKHGGVRVKHVSFDRIGSWQERFAGDGGNLPPNKVRAYKLIG